MVLHHHTLRTCHTLLRVPGHTSLHSAADADLFVRQTLHLPVELSNLLMATSGMVGEVAELSLCVVHFNVYCCSITAWAVLTGLLIYNCFSVTSLSDSLSSK